MNTRYATLLIAAAFGLMMSPSVSAQEGDLSSQVEELKQIQQDLQTEMSGLRRELAALNGELRKLRTELTKTVASLKSAQRKPARQRQRPAMTMLGKKGPDFAITTLDGQQIKIGGKREKPQVLFCYASWCGFCKKSLPWMEALHLKYKDQGVEVLALNLDDRGKGGRARTEEQTRKHYQDLKLSMPMSMTTATNDTKKIGAAYKARSFPTLFVLGTSGEVESVHVGAKAGLDKIVGKELDLLMQGKTRAAFPK
ncbi:MAG: redoxin domain-containing protein [Phycisphaerae bacterium]